MSSNTPEGHNTDPPTASSDREHPPWAERVPVLGGDDRVRCTLCGAEGKVPEDVEHVELAKAVLPDGGVVENGIDTDRLQRADGIGPKTARDVSEEFGTLTEVREWATAAETSGSGDDRLSDREGWGELRIRGVASAIVEEFGAVDGCELCGSGPAETLTGDGHARGPNIWVCSDCKAGRAVTDGGDRE